MITKIAQQIAALPFVYGLIQRAVGCGQIFKQKFHSGSSVLVNGCQLCFREQSIDFGLFAAVSHQRNVEECDSVLAALPKILRHRRLMGE